MKKYLSVLVSLGLTISLLLSLSGCKTNDRENSSVPDKSETEIKSLFDVDGIYNKIGAYHISDIGEVYGNKGEFSMLYAKAVGYNEGSEEKTFKVSLPGKVSLMSYKRDHGAFLTDTGEIYITGAKLSCIYEESSVFKGAVFEDLPREAIEALFYMEPKKLDTEKIQGKIIKMDRSEYALTVLTDTGKVYIYGRYNGEKFDEENPVPREIGFPEKITDFKTEFFCVTALSDTGNVYRVGYPYGDFQRYKPDDENIKSVQLIADNIKLLGDANTFISSAGEVFGIGHCIYLPLTAYDSDMWQYLGFKEDWEYTFEYTRNVEKADVKAENPVFFTGNIIMTKDGTVYYNDSVIPDGKGYLKSEKTVNSAEFTYIPYFGLLYEENGKIYRVTDFGTWETEEKIPVW